MHFDFSSEGARGHRVFGHNSQSDVTSLHAAPQVAASLFPMCP